MPCSRIRAAPTVMSRMSGRGGPARTTARRARMPSTCSAALTARVSAMPVCAARPAISKAIPVFCMGRRAPRTGISRRPKWSGSASLRRKSAPRSRIRRAMADARWRKSRRMCATTNWSAGAGLRVPAVSRRRARQRKHSWRFRHGRRPVLHARPVSYAMNFPSFLHRNNHVQTNFRTCTKMWRLNACRTSPISNVLGDRWAHSATDKNGYGQIQVS